MSSENNVRRWKRYPAYKESGFLWTPSIPVHWSMSRLKHIAAVRPSNVDKKSVEGEKAVRLCNYVDVYKNDYITPDLDFMAATATDSQIAAFKLQAGDVIITKDSESWDDIAVPAYVPQSLEGIVCGYHLSLIRPRPDQIHGAYLFRCFSAEGICDQFRVAANGIIRFGLGTEAIASSLFPVPPLDEQRRIAAFLDRETAKLDAPIATKERLIALLQEKRTALISHAVTKGLDPTVPMKDSGVEWLGQIPAHWEVKKIKFLATILRGKFTHRPRNDPRFYDGTYPFIQTGDVAAANKYVREYHQTLNELGFAVSKRFPSGTLVMAIAANIGDLAVLTFPACFPDSIVGFVPKQDVDIDFLYFGLSAMRQEMKSTAVLNTQLNLNVDRIGGMKFILPRLDEQKAIVQHIEGNTAQIEALINSVREGIVKLREYRSALISAAVTGKIDVREEGQT